MINRPISKSISRGISLSINDPNGAWFNPISLFAAGEQGVWYDPSDLSTLFQDAAGTIPVTAAGQPVGLMRDKSGRGNHAFQATATSRPILQAANGLWYLVFDGVDDSLQTGNINFSATNKLTAWSGLLKASDVNAAVLYELSASVGANNGSFSMLAPSSNGVANYSAGSRGSLLQSRARTPFPAPSIAVLTHTADIAAPSVALRVNTTTDTPTTLDQGTGNYGNYPLYIGRRGGATIPFNGNLYGLIIRGAASTAQQITDTENYINSKTGAYGPASPADLFRAGEQGAWYDPSDLSTLFQDPAGTIPVTGAGQPVGKMLDKSGRGNHATQSTATSRPILQTASGKWYLAFDGVDDGMVTGSINLTTNNKLTAWAGLTKVSDASVGVTFEFSADINTNNGAFAMYAPFAGNSYGMVSRGTIYAALSRTPFTSPHTAVLVGTADIAAPSVALRVNTATAAAEIATQGAGNYGNYPLYIGRRGGATLPFNGHLYGLIVRVAASTNQEITDNENWLNNKTGAY